MVWIFIQACILIKTLLMFTITRYILVALIGICPYLIYAQTPAQHQLYYDTDQYDANRHQKAILDMIQDLEPGQTISIIGHTDSVGTETYNKHLGLQRATEVQAQLRKAGVSNPINILSEGESAPIADNGTASGRQKNRRVDVILSVKDIIVQEKALTSTPNIRDLLSPLQPKPIVHMIDPNKQHDIALGTNGTMLHVPANAFVDANGKLITSPVELTYTLYANAADMLFSEIPMTIQVQGEQQRFNSAGMFQLTGTAQGSPVEIAEDKKLNIDFALTNKPDNIAFFQLDNGKAWKKVQDIEPDPIPVNPEIVVLAINDEGIFADTAITDEEFTQRRFTIWDPEKVEWDQTVESQPLNKQSGSLIRGTDPSHQYPDIVAGLNVGDFGVYNCDQIYRVGSPIAVDFVYKDISGKKIPDMHIVSLIDLDYNGAFSFAPESSIMLNETGKNVIAVFTRSGRIFIADASNVAFAISKSEPAKTLLMKDMTNEITSTADLAKYLGL